MKKKTSLILNVICLLFIGAAQPSEKPNNLLGGCVAGCSIKSKNPVQEDFFKFGVVKHKGKKYLLAGVFDGHGGYSVAQVVSHSFIPMFENNLKEDESAELISYKANFQKRYEKQFSKINCILERTINQLEGLFLFEKDKYLLQGTTALISVICLNSGECCLANIGNSRAFLKNEEGVFITRDHKSWDPQEEEYVLEKAKDSFYDQYLDASLVLTRTLGDNYFKYDQNGVLRQHPVVRAIADITQHVVTDGSYILLATDGFWDTVSNSMVDQLVHRALSMAEKEFSNQHNNIQNPETRLNNSFARKRSNIVSKAACFLADYAVLNRKKEGSDNTTVILQLLR
jgi:serine/threonine protein phosphatase PrpC